MADHLAIPTTDLERRHAFERDGPRDNDPYVTKPFPQTNLSLPVVSQDFTFYMDLMLITSLSEENINKLKKRKTRGVNIRMTDENHLDAINNFAPEYTGALVLIESTTRKAWVFPLHTKNGKEVLFAFKLFLRDIDMRISRLISDSGAEYNEIKRYNNQKRLFHYFQANASQNMHTTLSRIDRFIRTLRQMIRDYYNRARNPNWVAVIKRFVARYNETQHSSLFLRDPDRGGRKIFYTPNQVWHSPELRRRIKIKDYLAKHKNYAKLDRMFRVGSVVRYRVMPGKMKDIRSNGFLSQYTAIIRNRVGNSFEIQMKRFDDGRDDFTGSVITIPARDLYLESRLKPVRSKYSIDDMMYGGDDSDEDESDSDEDDDGGAPAPVAPPPPAPAERRSRYGRLLREHREPDFIY